MKKILILLAVAFAILACDQKWNDLVHEEVPAEITAFEVEGQVSSSINKSKKTVTVLLPEETDLSQLTVRTFSYTEGAQCSRPLSAGQAIDLTAPVTLTLTTYDPYQWTLAAEIQTTPVTPDPGPDNPDDPDNPNPPTPPAPKDGPQLYNMSFDYWSKSSSLDVCYGSDATAEEKAVWGSANATTAPLGQPTVGPEYDFVAVPGEGKAALKLQTRSVLGKLAAGSLFNGEMGSINIWTMSASLDWGIPFSDRPASLEGYYCYKPATINIAQSPYQGKKGELDNASIIVLLTDWDKPFTVNPPESLVDYDNDEKIIGLGKLTIDKSMENYEKFHLDIKYRSDRTPKYVTIVLSSSALGDYFTGGVGSVFYLDEFKFLY